MIVRALGWLLGCRVRERTEDSWLIRLPRWAHNPRVLPLALERVRRDARVAWPGDELDVEVGHRLVRLTRRRRGYIGGGR